MELHPMEEHGVKPLGSTRADLCQATKPEHELTRAKGNLCKSKGKLVSCSVRFPIHSAVVLLCVSALLCGEFKRATGGFGEATTQAL